MINGVFNEAEAVDKVRDAIIHNGSQLAWVREVVVRNNESLKALIENDTFGALSDYPETYPNATLTDKLNILKAFVENEGYEGFNVPEITLALRTFVDDKEQRERQLEEALFGSQRQGQTPWQTKLPISCHNAIEMLDKVQILNYIEKLINEAPNKAEYAALQTWLAQKRHNIATRRVDFTYESEIGYFLGGSNSFRKLIRNEVAGVVALWQRVKNTVLTIAALTDWPPLSTVLRDSMLMTLRLGMLFLLPYRLLLTSCREGAALVQRSISYLVNYFMPENQTAKKIAGMTGLIVKMALMCLAINYFGFSFKLLLGLQMFPQSWSWGFIGQMTLGFAAVETAAGVLFGVGSRVNAYLRTLLGQPVEVYIPVPVPVEHNPVSSVANAPQPIADLAPLSGPQRNQLIRILMAQTQKVARSDMSDAEKAEARTQISTEQSNLRNQAKPYILSAFDLKLLAEREDLEGFDAFKDAIAQYKAQAPVEQPKPAEPTATPPAALAPLDGEQRKLLARMLKAQRQVVTHSTMPASEKTETRATISAEQDKLNDEATPYILSAFDLKVLAQSNNLQGFDAFKDAIARHKEETPASPLAPDADAQKTPSITTRLASA
jgi:hypothetical protein